MHPDQLTVDEDTVRVLVAAQFPEWRELPVRAVDSPGTVNAIFRLGDRLAARLPLQRGEVDATRAALAAEAAAARELLGRTPFPTPEPVALGEPGAGYPLPWSVQTWLPGVTASEADPGGSVAFATDLVAFVRAVRAIDTRGRTFRGTGRGGVLRDHDAWVAECLERSQGLVDVAAVEQAWRAVRVTPRSTADVMTHGDLMPGNVLVRSGRLAGVLDVGGLGPADPALDLVAAWHLLDEAPRATFREALGCHDDEWARGQGWALQQAVAALWYYADSNPAMHRTARRTLARILADPVA